MKKAFCWFVIWIATFGLAASGLAQDDGTGMVSGIIRVEKARVKTGGAKTAKDVIVYLKPLAPASFMPPSEHAVMDQRGLVFIPHVMSIQVGTTVDFLNSDHDRHNVYFLYDKTGETLDIVVKIRDRITRAIDLKGRLSVDGRATTTLDFLATEAPGS